MMCVRLLELFVNCEDFYGYDERINYALEYILINLSHVTRDGKETLFLLRLLSKLLYRNNSCMDHSFRNIFDKERIMEVLLKLTKLKSIQKSNFAFYAAILTRLLDPNFSDSLNHLLSALFDVFQKYELRTEQIVVCKLILASSSKILKTAFKNVWDWLIWECPTLLSKSVDLNVLEDIIHCLTTSMDIWLREKNTQDNPSISWKQINKLFQNLYKLL
ncbi:uncharacterized protein LOC135120838 [Zophobas morio]|uniref:uncharacterized protein LOC135120838 n=1 Tax=Zophobas morio TaxID=2755281 RepID=UPI003083A947